MARELHLDQESTVVSRHQERCINGAPWSLQSSFYPMRLVEQGATQLIQAANISPGVVSYLKEALGIEQAAGATPSRSGHPMRQRPGSSGSPTTVACR